jgi:hypothetical protein
MFTYILVASLSSRPSTFSLIKGMGNAHAEAGDRYAVHAPGGMNDGWMAVEYLGAQVIGYDEDELADIKRLISDPCFFLVEGRDGAVNYSDNFIMQIDGSLGLLVDNDHGVIDSLADIKEKIANGIQWKYLR